MAKKAPIVPPNSEDLETLLRELSGESDRGAALIGAAYIDDSLKHVFLSRLGGDEKTKLSLLDFDGPIGSFSSRIKLAYCLGWIGTEFRSDLDTLRGIRNDFAHERAAISFSTESVRDRCKNLNALALFEKIFPALPILANAKIAYGVATVAMFRVLLELAPLAAGPPDGLDEQYRQSTATTLVYLSFRNAIGDALPAIAGEVAIGFLRELGHALGEHVDKHLAEIDDPPKSA
jgi:DNA-binding MltR family transcriptional regulator